ncbi:DUF2255 family protein [Demequina lignilytica]|uniref:DUF2255 family protein n=1 Tax=Demequina lignilytica TaxID=3051663 RepID=A0AAW7M839_9MICO|nr:MULTISPECIES: DUF2255 family protein [unclassified Demequina]MDN4478556.1 DUF2255 family protein [Demequina sp. SYSU T00039-1]MDN4482286.1 DUF2255 family protein [Demequina sp. SYSU T0a273]MDN4486937.1 DUF2255 family protein [Demequina sp. SYSU T00039]
MAAWDPAVLASIAASDDLKISPFREDGTTYGTPTWIWSVVVDDALYVRAYNGRRSRWYRAAMAQGAGRIHAAGRVIDVTFVDAAGEDDAAIDAAYRAKYADSPYLPPMVSARTREATVRIAPIA